MNKNVNGETKWSSFKGKIFNKETVIKGVKVIAIVAATIVGTVVLGYKLATPDELNDPEEVPFDDEEEN